MQTDWSETALTVAVRSGPECMVLLLLKHEAKTAVHSDTDTQHQRRLSEVTATEAGDHNKMSQVSPGRKTDPWRLDSNGRTVLRFASAEAHVQIMESWLRHGADLLALDEQGRNWLHHAASKGSNIAVHGLLGKYNFDPNRIDRNGWMALHRAAKSLRGGTMARIARISRTSIANTHLDDRWREGCSHVSASAPKIWLSLSTNEHRLYRVRYTLAANAEIRLL